MITQKHTTGYSLVEVLVAISILLIAVVGPMTIAMKGLQTAYYAREKATALFLAQEGIEAIVAARNDGIIEAFNAGNLANSWDWQTDSDTPNIRLCFTSDGCNLDFKGGDTTSTIIRCSAQTDCRLYFTEGDNIPYSLSSGGSATESPYMRVIKLSEIGGGARDKEVSITSTVYWDATLFKGGDLEKVELHSTVFSLYE